MRARNHVWVAALVGAGLVTGCDDGASVPLAPTATALETAKPAAAGAQRFEIEQASGKTSFAMEAPKEKIRGRVDGAMTGEASINLSDLSKSTLNVTVDIGGIELYQRLADDDGEFSEESKSDMQNAHAREWLEIGESAPEEIRKKNSRAQFVARTLDKVSAKDVTKLTGAERKVTATVTGDFLLHGRKSQQTVEIEAVFTFDGDKATSVSVRTTKAFKVDLAAHDVRPRSAFGKLAKKTLEQMAPKVAKEAEVSLEFVAKVGD